VRYRQDRPAIPISNRHTDTAGTISKVTNPLQGPARSVRDALQTDERCGNAPRFAVPSESFLRYG